MSLADERARVRRDLGAILERVEVVDSTENAARLHGSARFGAALVGPPERLHGGLHAYARLLPVLAAVPSHDPAATFPCRLTLDLYRALLLEESVRFDARYARTDAGYALDVRHAENDRLAARVETAGARDARLAWFRAAHEATRGVEPERTIRAGGDVAMHVHPELVVMPCDRAMRTTDSPTFAKFCADDGALDAAAICVGLDLLAAVTQGYAWRSHIYTVRIDLVLEVAAIPSDVDLVMLADRRAEPDRDCTVGPVPLEDGRVGEPSKVRVLLADARIDRAFAHGTLTIVPAKKLASR